MWNLFGISQKIPAVIGLLLLTVGCGNGNVQSKPTTTYAYVLTDNFASSPNFTFGDLTVQDGK